MMKTKWLYAFAFAWLAAACAGTSQSQKEELCVIDVEGAMNNQTELKLSELGSDVRYVALETNDSCLVGAKPNIMLLKNQIVVTFGNQCLLFDKETGKFICKVGHAGDDPEAYSNPNPIYSDADESLYFVQGTGILQKYDLAGKYGGNIRVPKDPVAPADYCFTDSMIVGHYNNILGGHDSRSLLFFNDKGEQLDTIPGILPALAEKKTDDINSISVIKKGNSGILLINYKDGSSSANMMGNQTLWQSNNKLRFKENYNDTIYTVQGKELIPYMVFSTGKWNSGIEARSCNNNGDKVLLFGSIFETPDNLFFQCFENYTEPFNGIYDRKGKITRICPQEKGFSDDLTGFLPFHPRTCSMQGEYGNIVEAGDVLSWMEENPDAAKKETFAGLKKLTDDSNPVVVITVSR